MKKRGKIMPGEKPTNYLVAPVEDERRRLDKSEVQAYLEDTNNVVWVSVKDILGHLNDACVDGRETEPIVATPGGDIALLGEGIVSLGKLAGIHLSPVEINKVFRLRLESLGSIYMHTDEHALENLGKSLSEDKRFKGRKFNTVEEVFKFVSKPPIRLQVALLDHLCVDDNIGCGHLKLMLSNPAAYGMSRKVVMALIRSFFDTMWNGTEDEKKMISYTYLRGSHKEGAVVSILVPGEITEDSWVPAVRPTDGKTSMFVFHPQISSYMHKVQAHQLVESGLFPELSVEQVDAFYQTQEETLQEHLRETVGRLAGDLPQYAFTFKTQGVE